MFEPEDFPITIVVRRKRDGEEVWRAVLEKPDTLTSLQVPGLGPEGAPYLTTVTSANGRETTTESPDLTGEPVETVLPMWIVYEHPLDYPHDFVARKWRIRRGTPDPVPTDDLLAAPTLDELRALLPPGLARIAPSLGDEPQIVETWL
jgi:hypothetical protein